MENRNLNRPAECLGWLRLPSFASLMLLWPHWVTGCTGHSNQSKLFLMIVWIDQSWCQVAEGVQPNCSLSCWQWQKLQSPHCSCDLSMIHVQNNIEKGSHLGTEQNCCQEGYWSHWVVSFAGKMWWCNSTGWWQECHMAVKNLILACFGVC